VLILQLTVTEKTQNLRRLEGTQRVSMKLHDALHLSRHSVFPDLFLLIPDEWATVW